MLVPGADYGVPVTCDDDVRQELVTTVTLSAVKLILLIFIWKIFTSYIADVMLNGTGNLLIQI